MRHFLGFRLFAMLGLLAFTMAALPASAERLFVRDTNDGYLNLRAGPGTGYAIVTRLHGGAEADGVGAAGSWRRIVLPDGTAGWASAGFLTQTYRQERPYDAHVVRTNDGYLNLRAGPGTSWGIVRRLYAGTGVFDGGRQGNWLFVTLADGTQGWVSGNFLR